MVVDSTAYRHTSIALDSNSNPWIAYQTYDTSFHVKVARWAGSQFTIQDVTNPGCCSDTTVMAAGSNGGVFVAYNGDYSNNGGDVTAFQWTGTSFSPIGAYGGYPASPFGADVDSAGKLHVGYADEYGGLIDLLYDTSTTATAVDSTIKSGFTQVDIEGAKRGIVICSSAVGVKLARFDGIWTLDNVATSASGTSLGCAVAVDKTGGYHIGYAASGKVNYTDSTSSYKAVAIADGDGIALAVDPSGKPQVLYRTSAQQLYYAK
jgi:hypothetical protein